MNKMFCVSCGFKVHYEVSKPKFCSSCGYNFVGESKSKTKESSEGLELTEDINVERLKKDISVEYNSKKTTVKDLLSTSHSDNPEYSPRPALNSAEGEEIIKQIREECATSRSRDVDE